MRRKDKYIALSSLSIYYAWKNIRKTYRNNKFKILGPTWNDGAYSKADIPDYFEYILKKHAEKQLIF